VIDASAHGQPTLLQQISGRAADADQRQPLRNFSAGWAPVTMVKSNSGAYYGTRRKSAHSERRGFNHLVEIGN